MCALGGNEAMTVRRVRSSDGQVVRGELEEVVKVKVEGMGWVGERCAGAMTPATTSKPSSDQQT
jgi:hypothetical protein